MQLSACASKNDVDILILLLFRVDIFLMPLLDFCHFKRETSLSPSQHTSIHQDVDIGIGV